MRKDTPLYVLALIAKSDRRKVVAHHLDTVEALMKASAADPSVLTKIGLSAEARQRVHAAMARALLARASAIIDRPVLAHVADIAFAAWLALVATSLLSLAWVFIAGIAR